MSKENENGNFAKPMLGAVVSDIKDNKIMLLKEHLDNVYGNQKCVLGMHLARRRI